MAPKYFLIVVSLFFYRSSLFAQTPGSPAQITACLNSGIINKDTQVCNSTVLQLNAKPALSYNWTPASGISDPASQNPTLTVDRSQVYSLNSLVYTQNLVVNGDFELGNTGFFTTYTYCNTNNCLYPLANDGYSVGPDANFVHILFQGKDHTTGSGNFMIVNGADPNLVVWRETIPVAPETDYAFGAWVSTLITVNPSKVRFSINGVQIGQIFNAPAQINQWERVFSTWNSGTSTTATIEVVDIFDQASGNDFALDDIFFAATLPCTSSFKVTVPIAPSFSIGPPKDSICKGDLVSLTAVPQINEPDLVYQWQVNGINTNDHTNIFSDSLLKNDDIINCRITASSGCSTSTIADTTVSIFVYPTPTVNLQPEVTILTGGTVQLEPATTGDIESYLWTPSTGLNNNQIMSPIASPSVTTTYTLVVASTDGCKASDQIAVKLSSGNLMIPNAFSPNADGKNDVFYILGNRDVKIVQEFSIFNRFGQKIFEVNDVPSGDRKYGWNGTYDGKKADAGTYVYFAVIEFSDGKKQIFKGTVILIM